MNLLLKPVMAIIMALPWETLVSYVIKRLAQAGIYTLEKWLKRKEKQAAKTESVADDELYAMGVDIVVKLREFLDKL